MQRLPPYLYLPYFRGQTFHGFYTDVYVEKESRWKSEIQDSGFENAVAQISACISNSEIPMAIPMFPGSGNTIRLLWRLPDMWIKGGVKMAAINRM